MQLEFVWTTDADGDRQNLPADQVRNSFRQTRPGPRRNKIKTRCRSIPTRELVMAKVSFATTRRPPRHGQAPPPARPRPSAPANQGPPVASVPSHQCAMDISWRRRSLPPSSVPLDQTRERGRVPLTGTGDGPPLPLPRTLPPSTPPIPRPTILMGRGAWRSALPLLPGDLG